MRLNRKSGLERLEQRYFLTVVPTALPLLNLRPPSEIRVADEQDIVLAGLQADFNGDNHLDLIVADDSFAGVSVFLGIGDGTLESALRYAFPGEITSLSIADFNGDQQIDIVGSSSAGVSVLLNQGTNESNWQGFVLTAFIAGRADSVTAGDVDGDDQDDLIIGISGTVQVSAGHGNGEFSSPINYTSAEGARIVRLGDADGDGDLDLFAGIVASHEIVVLLNDGGVFETEVARIDIEQEPATFELADVDADGLLDLIVGQSNQNSGNLSVWPGLDSVGFGAPTRYDILGPINSIHVGRFDADDAMDLLVAHDGTFHHLVNGNGPGGVSVVVNDGSGLFFEPIRTRTPGTVAAFMGDLNGDGFADITSAESFGGLGHITLQSPSGGFGDRAEDYNLGPAMGWQLADLNDDGRSDYIAMTQDNAALTTTLTTFLSDGPGAYFAGEGAVLEQTLGNLMLSGDFNGDGSVDLALVGLDANILPLAVFIPTTDEGKTFGEPIRTPLDGRFWAHAEVADLNNDGLDDIVAVVTDTTERRLQTLLGRSDGGFEPAAAVVVSNEFSNFELGLIDDDDILDIGISESSIFLGTGNFRPLLGNGDGLFTEAAALPAGGIATRYGDFNGDDHTDAMFLSGLLSASLTVSYGNGQGAFSDAIPVVSSDNFFTFEVADIDGDGRSDFVYDDFIVYGQEQGFSEPVSRGLGFNNGELIVVDVNGDNADDLIVASLSNAVTAAAEFAIVTELLATNDVELSDDSQHILKIRGFQHLALEDIDGDNDLDALLVHEQGFAVLRNPAGPVEGDVNSDGLVDAADIDHLCGQISSFDPNVQVYDLNADGVVDRDDVTYLVESILNTVPGDANLDGEVGFEDFLQLGFHFGQDGEFGWAEADFSCDGRVQFDDFLLLSANFGTSRQNALPTPNSLADERLNAITEHGPQATPDVHDRLHIATGQPTQLLAADDIRPHDGGNLDSDTALRRLRETIRSIRVELNV